MRRYIHSYATLFFLMWSLVAYGAEGSGSDTENIATTGCSSASVAIKATPGDTYIGLFGPAWQQVADCNPQTFIRNGRPISTPDLLAAGSIIRIPAGTPLTPAVTNRLQALERQRAELLKRLDKLQNAELDNHDRAMIAQSRELLNSRIRFASDADYAMRQIEYLEGQSDKTATDEPWWRSRSSMIAAGAVLLLIVGGILFAGSARPDVSETLMERQVKADLQLAEVCSGAGIRYKP